MKHILLTSMLALLAFSSVGMLTSVQAVDLTSFLSLQSPPAAPDKLNVDVDIGTNGGDGNWYANPLWVAIGALAVILLVVIVVVAARGGGGTVVTR